MSHVKSHRGSVKQQKKPLQKGHSYDFPTPLTHGGVEAIQSSIQPKCATLRLEEDHFAFGRLYQKVINHTEGESVGKNRKLFTIKYVQVPAKGNIPEK